MKSQTATLSPDVLQDEMRVVAEQVERILEDFFIQELQTVSAIHSHARHMLMTVRHFCLSGGKRLRPYLLLKGYELVQSEKPDYLISVAASLELIHAFFLIHDDIMDQSERRRGFPTIHKRYQEQFDEAGVAPALAQRYGESVGILAGDLMYTLWVRFVVGLSLPAPAVCLDVLNHMLPTVSQTIYGQEMDLRFETQAEVSAVGIIEMYRQKTARYTFEAPLCLGAHLGGASPDVLEALSRFSLAAGVAFQIQDDILGMFGEESVTGKSARDDLRQGKKTLLMVKALEMASGPDRLMLEQIVREREGTETAATRARRIIQRSGSLKVCQALMADYVDQARGHLLSSNIEANGCRTLETLLKLMVNRGK
jgi:geranylgeranyl pyrophosphate synthase